MKNGKKVKDKIRVVVKSIQGKKGWDTFEKLFKIMFYLLLILEISKFPVIKNTNNINISGQPPKLNSSFTFFYSIYLFKL